MGKSKPTRLTPKDMSPIRDLMMELFHDLCS
jgi:hypothetical protein